MRAHISDNSDGRRTFFWLKLGKPDPQAVHVGLVAKDPGEVDAFYKAALKAGGKSKEEPQPRLGTNNNGDTPQEILFIVTDGVDDALQSTNISLATAYGSPLNPQNNAGNEVLTDYCTAIKGRGIRIAILYTQYLPIPNNGWYSSYVKPILSNVGPQLQACASPNLYSVVTTDGDISAALQQLFNAAVESAYLVK